MAMPVRNIIVIGASAGGVEALSQLVKGLPAHFEASLFIVVHFPVDSISLLPRILSRAGELKALHASDGQVIQRGCIYVAPPNNHLIFNDGRIQLGQGPRYHGFRPAIDTLFISAAETYGARVVGIILSGSLSDGVAGLQRIKNAGGVTIVQEPGDASFSGLPVQAINTVDVDYILPISQIAGVLNQLVSRSLLEEEIETANPKMDSQTVKSELENFENGGWPQTSTVLTCPECGGVLWELREGELVRYRCHVGHTYSSESMLSEQAKSVEASLWAAVRSLEERAALLKRLAIQAETWQSPITSRRFRDFAQETDAQADTVRRLIAQGDLLGFLSVDPSQVEPPPVPTDKSLPA